jgi:DNA topoisomerase-1
MNKGDCPKKHGVDATHFTQPPPRYSEASLVKRLEELGIGRPSTYAATLQVLKDRNYVRIEKNRFFAEESGRMLTAFLERFFDRYVAYEFTAGMEDELDDVSGGRAAWKQVLAEFWRDFKPKSDEVMEKKPSEVTAELDVFLEDYLFPRAPTARSARMPSVAMAAWRCAAAAMARSLPARTIPSASSPASLPSPAGPRAARARMRRRQGSGNRPGRRAAPGGSVPIQLGEGKEARPSQGHSRTRSGMGAQAAHLPREVGMHPERQADHRLDRPLWPLSGA